MPHKRRTAIRASLLHLSIVISYVRSFTPLNWRTSLSPARQSRSASHCFRKDASDRVRLYQIVNWNFDEEEEEGLDLDDYCQVMDESGHCITYAEDEMEDGDEYCVIMDEGGCIAYEDYHAENDTDKVQEDSDAITSMYVHRWVRVEGRPDPCWESIKTKSDVLGKIDQVCKLQQTYGRADLYERRWVPSASPVDSDPDHVNGLAKPSFTAMQFNALAEGLSSGPNAKRPFPVPPDAKINKEKSIFGGFLDIKNPEISLDFDLRRWRLLEVILGGYGENEPCDLIALEEIDRFRGFFAPALRIFGYQGLFMPKRKSPGVRTGWYSDGLALFWKTGTFDLLSEEKLGYRTGSQILMHVLLRHIPSGKKLLVAVTHLKASNGEEEEKIRSAQAQELLDRVTLSAKEASSSSQEKDIPILILGDFNADPPSNIAWKDSSVGRVLNFHTTSEDARRFRSAYPIDPPESTFFTTWKTRGSGTVKRIIDYIFYNGLTCTANLSIPKEEDLEDTKLPGLRFPSDHLMVAARFDLD